MVTFKVIEIDSIHNRAYSLQIILNEKNINFIETNRNLSVYHKDLIKNPAYVPGFFNYQLAMFEKINIICYPDE